MVGKNEDYARSSHNFRIIARIVILAVLIPLFILIVYSYSNLSPIAYLVALVSISIAVAVLPKIVDKIAKRKYP